MSVSFITCAFRSQTYAIFAVRTACQTATTEWSCQQSFLSLDEIRRVSRAFAELGTEKVRLTGGEPSLRRDFVDIISAVRENPSIRTLAVTTNGYRMARDIADWRAAGLTAVNVSVDSLDARQFHAITGEDKLKQVMQGIDAAFDAGFEKVKVNTVLMRDVNDRSLNGFLNWIKTRPIQMRFIELMETGDGGNLFRKHHVSGEVIRDQLLALGWQRQERSRSDGPAQVFSHPDYLGEVGLIMPYEKTSAPAVTACECLPSAICTCVCSVNLAFRYAIYWRAMNILMS